MAKVILENGMVFEGTNDELVELFTKLGAKIPAVEEAEEAAPKPLKVGDYVKTLTKSKYGGIKEGEIVKVEQTNFHSFSGHKIAVRRDANSTDGLFRPSELIHATEEEIAEIERQQAEKAVAAKWASINRKPNEFKKGDIVRVINAEDSGHKAGDISEIIDAEPEGTYIRMFDVKVVNASDEGGWLHPEDMELITPVEARFDR